MGGIEPSDAMAKDYYRIVVLSDIHLPGRNFPKKEKALADINAWPDIDLVVVTGDILSLGGDAGQYALAKQFFGKLTKPVCFIGGNHDYIYPDSYPINPATGHHLKEPSPENREKKLSHFKKMWDLQELFYSRRVGGYLLVFLSPDDLTSINYAQMTERQLEWLCTELQESEHLPTIIFFHAPLIGTLSSVKITRSKSPESHYAEPAEKIRAILKQNPQVFLWVCGHVHFAPTNRDFKSGQNVFEGQVTAIHNADMDGSSTLSHEDLKGTKHDELWTNSLFLYRDRVIVRTFDHTKDCWMTDLDREIFPRETR
jgi:3',5'-cyclic-AMP phosphodiesterase